MIFVTLGTQDKSFKRLLEAIQKQIDKGIIKERIVVQAGCTKFDSKDMEIFDLIPKDQFLELMKECDLLITHGGVGSIIDGLNNNKKIIAAARLKQYNEHTNDHQLQIVSNFTKEGHILNLEDFDKLDEILLQIPKFKPKKYISNTKNMVKLISDYIEETNHKLSNIRIITIITIILITILALGLLIINTIF